MRTYRLPQDISRRGLALPMFTALATAVTGSSWPAAVGMGFRGWSGLLVSDLWYSEVWGRLGLAV